MEEVDVMVVVLAAVAMFVVGAAWYMGLFAKIWGEIHGFDKLSKEKQKEMQAKMGPYYGAQVVVTLITAFVLAKLIVMLPAESPYAIAFMVWAGFTLPAQVSAVIFGGSEPKWVVKKIAIMASGSLAPLLVAAAILSKVG